MSQTATGTAHYIGSAPPGVGGSAVTRDIWVNPTAVGQLRKYVSIANSGSVNNVLSLGSDAVSGTTNKASAFVDAAGATTQALSADVIATNTWNYLCGSWASNNAATCTGPAGSKATNGGFTTPTGLNESLYSGRTGDFISGVNGQLAHAADFQRILNDLEITYRRSGGNARWLNPYSYKRFVSGQSPVIDEMGVENLTVVGSVTAGTTDPILATYWTAAALGNQSYTQGSAIPTVNLTTKFDQMAAAVDYTSTLQQLSAPGTATTAVGAAATATNILVVASATGFASGGYASVTNNTTPVLILAVSGSTLLLGAMKTWAASDSVFPFTVSPLTINGITTTGNSLAGTPGAPAVGTYLNCLIRAANNTTATLIADSPLFNVTVASSGAAPSFSAGPTLTSANTDGYTFGATSTQTATWWQGVYARGSATPTPAQVIAGTGTGFVSHFSTALTLAVAGSNISTALVNPIYDVHHALTNGSGNSALASFTAQLKAPPTGKQYVPIVMSAISAITKANPAKVTSTAHGRTTGDEVQVFGVSGMTQINGTFTTCTVVDVNNVTLDGIDSTAFSTYTSAGILSFGQSVYSGASTLVATGDVGIADLATAEDGLQVNLFPNGAVSLLAGAVLRRQSFVFDFYDVSGNALVGVATSYFQDVAPLPPPGLQIIPGVFLAANQVVSVNAGTLATDVQGDTLSVSLAGLPSPLIQSGVNIQGTTGASSITAVTGTWTNNSTDSTTAPFNLVIGFVNPPNLAGLMQPQIDAALAQIYLTANYGTQDDNSIGGPAAQGVAIAQNPPVGVPVLPNSVINVSLSSGRAAPVSTPIVPTSKSGQLAAEEALGALLSYQVFESFGTIVMGATDQPGKIYRFCRIPASAQVIELQLMNDANPSGSSYRCGVLQPNGGGLIVPGSDAILLPSGTSLDLARPFWTNLYVPSAASTSSSVANIGKRIWELLGFSQDPSLPTQDALYDVCMTAITPGASGGNVAVRLMYLRAPDRGMIAASAVHN